MTEKKKKEQEKNKWLLACRSNATRTAAMGSSSAAPSNLLSTSFTCVTSNSTHTFLRPSKLSCITKTTFPPKISHTHLPRFHRGKTRAALDEDNQTITTPIAVQEQQPSEVCFFMHPFDDLLMVFIFAVFCLFNWDESLGFVSYFADNLWGSKRNSVLIVRFLIVWLSSGGFWDFGCQNKIR